MSPWHGHERHRPPWWPANEPWPPRGGPSHRGRRSSFRRFRWIALLILLLSLWGALSLAWIAAAAFRGIDAFGSSPTPLVGALVLAGTVIVLLALARAMRHFATPLGEIMEAADRVANGDYSARVREWGPPAMRSLARAFNTMTERLQRQDEQRRHLMADVAHELRTPLTVIQGRLEGLLDGIYARDDDRLAELLDETQILSRLIDDLRTLALSEGGALKLQKEPTDLAILMHDTIETLRAQADATRVVLHADVPADLPLLEIDPLRIREVLTNLLSNAVRHTPSGGQVSVTAARSSDGVITVTVADSGEGMPPEVVARIFERFYKGPGSRGSGLGLSIAKTLVTAHGGEISAASAPGLGTTVTFTLPSSM